MSLLKKLWDCFTSPSETVKILTESEPALADIVERFAGTNTSFVEIITYAEPIFKNDFYVSEIWDSQTEEFIYVFGLESTGEELEVARHKDHRTIPAPTTQEFGELLVEQGLGPEFQSWCLIHDGYSKVQVSSLYLAKLDQGFLSALDKLKIQFFGGLTNYIKVLHGTELLHTPLYRLHARKYKEHLECLRYGSDNFTWNADRGWDVIKTALEKSLYHNSVKIIEDALAKCLVRDFDHEEQLDKEQLLCYADSVVTVGEIPLSPETQEKLRKIFETSTVPREIGYWRPVDPKVLEYYRLCKVMYVRQEIDYGSKIVVVFLPAKE